MDGGLGASSRAATTRTRVGASFLQRRRSPDRAPKKPQRSTGPETYYRTYETRRPNVQGTSDEELQQVWRMVFRRCARFSDAKAKRPRRETHQRQQQRQEGPVPRKRSSRDEGNGALLAQRSKGSKRRQPNRRNLGQRGSSGREARGQRRRRRTAAGNPASGRGKCSSIHSPNNRPTDAPRGRPRSEPGDRKQRGHRGQKARKRGHHPYVQGRCATL